MANVPIITLTTDLGYKDPWVGIMKGVILGVNPAARVVDLSHLVSKYSVREAAILLGMGYRDFPPRTIHVVVVDPGVGSSRRPILVTTENHYFIGPDNGVFTMVYNENAKAAVYHLTEEHYFRPVRSATFHGRDIFAPVAGWLSKGISPANLGEPVTDYVKLRIPSVTRSSETTIEGEVIYVDAFGNAMTNIRREDIDALRASRPDGKIRCAFKGKDIAIKEYFSQVEDKGLYALFNSSNYLEFFVYRGNAAREHEIKIGDRAGVMMA